jgi:hypothetical protein
MTPRHTRVDLRADLHLRDAQRLHAGAGGFAAGHHQLAHAKATRPRAMAAMRALHHGARLFHPQLALHRLDGAGVGRRIHQHRATGQQGRGPGQRLGRHINARRNAQRVTGQAGRPAAMKCSTCRLVASEQLPDTTACSPVAVARALACGEGASPKLAGSQSPRPSPL